MARGGGGYPRSLDAISLGEPERSENYRSVRADRIARGGRYEPSAEAVSRDVVASERIEGVDGRSWIPRQGS